MKTFYRNVIRFIFLAIVILTVDLLVNFMNQYVFTLRMDLNSYYVTAMRMIFIIVSYFIAIGRIEAFTSWFFSTFLKASQSVLGTFWGIIALFFAAFFGLFIVYHKIWFGDFGPVKEINGVITPVYTKAEKAIRKIIN